MNTRRNPIMQAMLIAVLLLCCAAPCALAGSYGYGDEAAEIAVIQTALEELKLYYTDITGHYGKRTETAVRKFQKRYGLAQTGIADEETIDLLYRVTGTEAPQESMLPAQSYGTQTLREGSCSDAVRLLQENLTLLEFYSGSITGSYGRLTKEAVRRFQRANDLSADGVAGPRTFEKLAELLTDEGAQEAPTVTLPAPDDAESKAASASVSLRNVSLLNTEWTLRRSSRSGYVTRLQKALIALGYLADGADGKFGSKTEEAVKTYQAAKGLTVDGIAGRATLRTINEDIKNGVTASSASVD